MVEENFTAGLVRIRLELLRTSGGREGKPTVGYLKVKYKKRNVLPSDIEIQT